MMAMEKDTILGFALLAISGLIALVLVAYQLQTLIQAIAEIALIVVGSTATLGAKLLFSEKSTLEKNPYFNLMDAQLIRRVITNKIQELPDLSYLTIHYSRVKDNAKSHHRPYYVVNNRTKKAYWVREELVVLNSRAIIQSNGHDGKEDLELHLSNNNVDLVRRYSELGEL